MMAYLSDVARKEALSAMAFGSVPICPSLALRLEAVTWDFSDRIGHSEIEGLHPYPAKFIAELPGALLDILPIPDGAAVLDPFCGSGTTLVECQKRGVPSIGIDLNPIACLMSRVKTGPAVSLPPGIAETITAKARRTTNPAIPSIPNLDHWFQKHVQKALAALTGAIATMPHEHQDLLRLALSSIIVRVSNQESDTRYAAIDKNVSEEEVYSAFGKAIQRASDALSRRGYSLADASVIEADTLTVRPEQIGRKIGIVITSPPYPNAYEYWLYHKYRMWWLGFDPLAVKELEIGARAHFFKRNHHTALDFVRQMTGMFALLKETVIAGGFACFIVGRSKIHGEVIDNARVIEEAGALVGFHRIFSIERVLSPHRKSFNLSHANIKTETVLVLRRGEIACV